MTTTQIAYLFQEGIPEYNSSAVYQTNSIVKKAGTYEIYGSKINENIGNALPSGVDNANWEFLQDLSLTTVPDATTSIKGIAMLATIADVRARNTVKIVTPDLLHDYAFRTGDFKGTTGSSLQSGWVWAAGTIGNASSNATNRANADTQALFEFYWNDAAYNYTGGTATGAALQVFDSAGTPVAKGASAAADYAANRQISIPDMRDRVPAGRGNMVGNAGRLSGQPFGVSGNSLGASGGQESHTLTDSELAAHTHGIKTINGALGTIGGGAAEPVDPSYIGPPTPTVDRTTMPEGGDSPHNNVQPTIICNYIIKL